MIFEEVMYLEWYPALVKVKGIPSKWLLYPSGVPHAKCQKMKKLRKWFK